MYGFAHPVITPEPFGLKMSVEYVAMVVLGGVGTMFGAVSGALAFSRSLRSPRSCSTR